MGTPFGFDWLCLQLRNTVAMGCVRGRRGTKREPRMSGLGAVNKGGEELKGHMSDVAGGGWAGWMAVRAQSQDPCLRQDPSDQ